LEDDVLTTLYDEESGLYDISLSHTIDESKLFSEDMIEAVSLKS